MYDDIVKRHSRSRNLQQIYFLGAFINLVGKALWIPDNSHILGSPIFIFTSTPNDLAKLMGVHKLELPSNLKVPPEPQATPIMASFPSSAKILSCQLLRGGSIFSQLPTLNSLIP